MSELTEHLETIREWHRSHAMPVAELLQPGLPADEVARQLSEVGTPSPELIELYGWRNGTANPKKDDGSSKHTLGEKWWFPGFVFVPLEEAIVWQKHDVSGMLPVFLDYGGDRYLSRCSNSDATDARVWWRRYSWEELFLGFTDLTTMMRTIVHCYNAGIHHKGEDGYLESYDDLARELIIAFNPGVDYDLE